MRRVKFIALLLAGALLVLMCASCAVDTREVQTVERNYNTAVRGADEKLVAAEGSTSATKDAFPEKTEDGSRVTFEKGAFDVGNGVTLGEEYSGKTLDFAGVQLYGGEITLSGCEKTVIANLSAKNVLVIDPTCQNCGVVNSRIGGLDDSSSDGAVVRNNVIEGGAALNAPTIFRSNTVGGSVVAEGVSNAYIADCAISEEATLSGCYNPAAVNTAALGWNVTNSRFATLADCESTGSSQVKVIGSKNTLVTGCTAEGELSVDQTDSEHTYGGNIPGVTMTAGCDETQLPQIDNSRFVGMEPSDIVRDVDTASLELLEVPVVDYVYGHAGEGKTVSLPAGVYRVPEGEQANFWFDGVTNLRIDAYGVEFLFDCYTKSAFACRSCTNFELRGASIDYKYVPNTQGTVLKNGFEYIIWQSDEGYPDFIDDPAYYTVGNGAEGYRAGSDRPFADLTLGDRVRQDDGTFKIYGYFDLDAGDKVIFRGLFAHVNYFERCGGTIYEDVTVFGGSGFGFCEQLGDGGTLLNRIAFTPGPSPVEGGEERLISCCDATHTTMMRKGITVTNCFFEKMTDDATNVNGCYGSVFGFDKTTKTVSYGIGKSNYTGCCDDFRVGDRVLIYTLDGGLVCDAKATGATSGSGSDRKVSIDKTFDWSDGIVIENASANGDGFLYENCIVQNNRSRGFLIKAPNGTIRNCTLRDNGMSAILLKPEISDGWGECGFTWNVTIENNVIERSGFYNGNELCSPINVSSDREPTSDENYMLHSNIVIKGNVFRDRYTTYAINANGVKGLTIESNDFGTRIGEYADFANKYINALYDADDDEAYSVKIAGAADVTVRDNIYPASGAGVLTEDTALRVKVEDHK